MKIINYDKLMDKKYVVDSAFRVCNNASFPVEYDDVYEHLFRKDDFILKLLVDEENNIEGFGVFELYKLYLKEKITTMLYLSGMVIDPKYQGHNISRRIIKEVYESIKSDLVSLRTQNIAMAKSLINTFDSKLFVMPSNIDNLVLDYLRQVSAFSNIDENGIIRDCYPNQLYSDLDAIKNVYGRELNPNDALGVVVEPANSKVLSIFSK